MKTLYEYITGIEIPNWIDCHEHLFNKNDILEEWCILPMEYKKIVGFADMVLDEPQNYDHDKMISYYDNYIQNYYDKTRHILLATGLDADTIIDIHRKYPGIIQGFGELKCYNTYSKHDVPYGNLDWIIPVLEYNKDFNLPVYIHWDFINESSVNAFDTILSNYKFPIILCHCGMGYPDGIKGDPKFALHACNELQHKYSHLYFDISYSAAKYFNDNLEDIYILQKNRILFGGDANPSIKKVHGDKAKDYLQKQFDMVGNLYDKCDITKTAECLFFITEH